MIPEWTNRINEIFDNAVVENSITINILNMIIIKGFL